MDLGKEIGSKSKTTITKPNIAFEFIKLMLRIALILAAFLYISNLSN